ncbi:hypothetical protein HIM_05293 [Hirsutella minnesotensis 3608]|uniref:FAD-binding domain-containing protein n=1 Tax=Hirsutella minnesotensis 3608 TaxID=1043627 RepID=A0A0F8A0I7_9HYPO|nr:hypothetical protein HIM_05293 [Hirsutella minnesotensis 3608]
MDARGARDVHFLEGKTIFIVGGGIAGSTLVAGFRKLWNPALKPPTVVIFDRDSSDPTLRRHEESFTVSVSGQNEAGGLPAIQKLGLLESVLASAVAGQDQATGCFKIWGTDWHVLQSIRRKPIHGLPTSSLRISRRNLRRVLLDAAQGWSHGRVQWDSRCLSAARLENGRLRVRILRPESALRSQATDMGKPSDGKKAKEVWIEEEQDCDLLIVADGANSKLRDSLRPADRLQYIGVVLRGGLSRFDDSPLPSVPGDDWGFATSPDGASCFLSPVDDKSLVWAVGHAEWNPTPKLDSSDASAMRAVIERGRQLGAAFAEPFEAIVARTDPKIVLCINGRDKLPFAHEDIAHMPVIFIGDSNHAVGPFAGAGANLALADGWNLAEELCRGASLVDAVAIYDSISVPRAASVLDESRQAVRRFYGGGWRETIFWGLFAIRRWMSWAMAKLMRRAMWWP